MENTNKLLLIGVYQDAIIFPAFPSSILLALHITFDASAEKQGSAEIEFRLTYPDTPGRLQVPKVNVDFSEKEHGIVFNIEGVALRMGAAGEMTIAYRRDGGRWISLRTWDVREAEPSTGSTA